MRKLGMWGMALAIWGTMFLTGCGGDDGPDLVSPGSLRGRTFTLSGDSGPSSITFADSGNLYSLTRPDAQLAAVGTFRATRNGNSWNVYVTTPDARFTSELILSYAARGRGTYRFTEPGWQQSETGLFEEVGFVGNPTLPDPGSPGDPGSPVLAPTTLTQITMTGTTSDPAGAGPYTFTLSGGFFSDGMRSGTYTYTPTGGNQANLQLLYTGTNNGDEDNYTLLFFTGNSGAFAGTQQIGVNQPGNASGTFQYSGQ